MRLQALLLALMLVLFNPGVLAEDAALVIIKDFKFAPITHKIVGSAFWVKKLLNI